MIEFLVLSAILSPFATGSPAGTVESQILKLDNGDKSVKATLSDIKGRSPSPVPALLPRQSDINCQGSAFCERLGGSCDDALRKVIASNTYSTYDGYEQRFFSISYYLNNLYLLFLFSFTDPPEPGVPR